MKTKNKTKRIIKIALLGLALFIAIPFSMGMYAGFTSHTGKTGAITKTLKEHCDCNEVGVDMSAYGIQFSRADGVTGEKASFKLEGCNTITDVTAEAERLNNILNAQVEGYADLDVVELVFVNDGNRTTARVLNGTLQVD